MKTREPRYEVRRLYTEPNVGDRVVTKGGLVGVVTATCYDDEPFRQALFEGDDGWRSWFACGELAIVEVP